MRLKLSATSCIVELWFYVYIFCNDFVYKYITLQLQIEWCGPFVMVKAIKETTNTMLNDYLPMSVFPDVSFRHFGIPPLFLIKKREYVYISVSALFFPSIFYVCLLHLQYTIYFA